MHFLTYSLSALALFVYESLNINIKKNVKAGNKIEKFAPQETD